MQSEKEKAAEEYIRESRCVYCKDKNKPKCWKKRRDGHWYVCIDAFGDYQAHLAGNKHGYARAQTKLNEIRKLCEGVRTSHKEPDSVVTIAEDAMAYYILHDILRDKHPKKGGKRW